jgi:hypothetical protein
MLQSWTCSGGWPRRWYRCRWVRTTMPITVLCDSVTVSDLNPGKRGLNSQPRPYCRGGVSVLTHYLITWLEMDGQLGTHESRRPTRRTARNFFSTQNSSTPYLNIRTVFVTGEDKYSRCNSRRFTNTFHSIMLSIFASLRLQGSTFYASGPYLSPIWVQ